LKGICKCVSLRLIVLLISTVICTCLLYCSRANKMMMMMMTYGYLAVSPSTNWNGYMGLLTCTYVSVIRTFCWN